MKRENENGASRRRSTLRFLSNGIASAGNALAAPVNRPVKKKKYAPRPHLEKIGGMDKAVRDYVSRFVSLSDKRVLLLRTSIVESIQSAEKHTAIVNLKRMNDVRELNHFLSEVNKQLEDDALFVACAETKYFRKQRILKRYPFALNYFVMLADYFVKRVLPKLPVSHQVCRRVFQDRDKAMSKTESLGRLYAAGFSVLDHKVIGGVLYIVARKEKEPLFMAEKKYGPIFRMRRQGKGGKTIFVFKLRTMHSYSEFIQQYVYEKNQLAEGGKLRDDFRVSTLGRFARRYWLDELPMVINLFTGDLKLVGVRPLSAQYLSLYSDELKAIRLRHKPGLIPPYYADMPKTLDEIQQSEMRYLLQHEKHPVWTDTRYLCKAFWNIFFRRARSK